MDAEAVVGLCFGRNHRVFMHIRAGGGCPWSECSVACRNRSRAEWEDGEQEHQVKPRTRLPQVRISQGRDDA